MASTLAEVKDRPSQAAQTGAAGDDPGRAVGRPTTDSMLEDNEQPRNGFRGDLAPQPAPEEQPKAEAVAKKVLEEAQRTENILQHCRYEVQKDGSVLYLLRDKPAFVDHGNQLLMHKGAESDEEAVLAALLVAKEKFGAIELTGSPAFKQFALDVILRNKVDVRLKDPQQDARLREMRQQAKGSSTESDTPTVAPTSADGIAGNSPSPAPEVVPATPAEVQPAAELQPPADDPLALLPVRALDWWTTQRDAVAASTWPQATKDLLLQDLGPVPLPETFFWFDKYGQHQPRPEVVGAVAESLMLRQGQDRAWLPDAVVDKGMAALHGLPAEDKERILAVANQLATTGLSQPNDGKELSMANQSDKNTPELVLRGVTKNGNDYETTVLLFKGKGDYLQGFVNVDGEKHQVLAHINARNPDAETGEIKPNFLNIVKARAEGDDTKWDVIGHGNALNQRSDGKQVFFDEVLLNVNGKTVSARVGKDVGDEMHKKLGFKSPRVERPKTAAKDKSPADKPSPAAASAAPAAANDEAKPNAPRARRSGSRP